MLSFTAGGEFLGKSLSDGLTAKEILAKVLRVTDLDFEERINHVYPRQQKGLSLSFH